RVSRTALRLHVPGLRPAHPAHAVVERQQPGPHAPALRDRVPGPGVREGPREHRSDRPDHDGGVRRPRVSTRVLAARPRRRGAALAGRAYSLGLVGLVLPFWISTLIRTYAWIVILGNAGVVNRTLHAVGLVGAPLPILYNELGVTIGTVNVLLPFFVLPLYASMLRIDQRLLHAAASLGASQRSIFWRVFFPLTTPAMMAGAILVFMLTLGFYITPAVLGGGRGPMIANMLGMLINTFPRWELASAISPLLPPPLIPFHP